MDRASRSILRATALGFPFGIGTFLVVGIPTAVIPNQWFRRMTPTRPQDYIFLATTALIAAAIGTTYTSQSACPRQERKLTAGGLLSFLAVGCPICNKIVVLLLGVGGALNYFAPIQPVLGLASVALLGFTLFLRLRAIRRVPESKMAAV